MELAMSERDVDIGCLYTKADLVEMTSKAMDDLLEYVGGAAHLARMLNVDYHAVISWKRRGRISKTGMEKLATHPRLSSEFPITRMLPGISFK